MKAGLDASARRSACSRSTRSRSSSRSRAEDARAAGLETPEQAVLAAMPQARGPTPPDRAAPGRPGPAGRAARDAARRRACSPRWSGWAPWTYEYLQAIARAPGRGARATSRSPSAASACDFKRDVRKLKELG